MVYESQLIGWTISVFCEGGWVCVVWYTSACVWGRGHRALKMMEKVHFIDGLMNSWGKMCEKNVSCWSVAKGFLFQAISRDKLLLGWKNMA